MNEYIGCMELMYFMQLFNKCLDNLITFKLEKSHFRL